MSIGKRIFATGAVNQDTNTIMASNAPGVRINEGHILEVDGYEPILHDYLKRDFPLGVKVNSIEASGSIHIWNEQKKIASNTQAMDPKMGVGTGTPDYGVPVTDTDYGRDNWQNAVPHLYGNRIQYDYFTLKAEQRYGAFEDLTAKDYNDMIVDFTRVTADHFWNGRATGLADTTSANKWEYCGILSQITDISAIGAGVTISDALNTKIASLQMRLDYSALPNVIAMNTATYDLLVKEEQKNTLYKQQITTEILPGHKVNGFYTYVGTLPIVLTPFIKPETTDGKTVHKIVALNTNMIDRVWWFHNGAKFFELATPDNPLGNSRLLTDKMMLDFSTYILRAPHTGAHFIMTKEV